MKSLKDFIIEGYAAENNEWKVSNIRRGEYGFMWFDKASGKIGVISFDDIGDIAKLQGCNRSDYMDIDQLKVGETAYDRVVGYMYTRIW